MPQLGESTQRPQPPSLPRRCCFSAIPWLRSGKAASFGTPCGGSLTLFPLPGPCCGRLQNAAEGTVGAPVLGEQRTAIGTRHTSGPLRGPVQAAACPRESSRRRFHWRGVSSKTSRAGCVETRSMTSRRYTNGLICKCLQVCTREHRMAVRCAAASLPANNQFFLPSTIGRSACSAPLLSILSRPSSA